MIEVNGQGVANDEGLIPVMEEGMIEVNGQWLVNSA